MKVYNFIVLILFFTSCNKEPFDLYTLKNETEYSVNVQGFSHRGDKGNEFIVASEKMVIEPYSSKIEKVYFGEGSSNGNYFDIGSVDSVRIVFDNKKLLILECDLSNTQACHSIFEPFEASITQQDYEDAIFIKK